jgi:hypothetical protein
MKYISYNEEFLSKKELDQDWIRRLQLAINNIDGVNLTRIVDSTTIQISLDTGELINVRISISNVNDSPVIHRRVTRFTRSSNVEVEVDISDNSNAYITTVDSEYNDYNEGDTFIDIILSRIIRCKELIDLKRSNNKRINDFFNTLPQDELRDLFLELDDILGKSSISTVKDKSLYKVVYNTNEYILYDKEGIFRIDDLYVKIITELNSINHRLDFFGAKLYFSFRENERSVPRGNGSNKLVINVFKV